MGRGYACFFACLDRAQEPGHVLCQRAHGLQAFEVFFHFLGGVAVHLIPILRGDDGHACHHEIFIDDLKRRGSTASAAGNDGCRRLAAQLAACRIEKTVEKGGHLTRDACIIHGGADDDAVDLVEHIDDLVDDIVNGTEARLAAKSADKTTLHGSFADLDDLCLDAVFFEGICRFFERRIGAAVFTRTAVDEQNFHK